MAAVNPFGSAPVDSEAQEERPNPAPAPAPVQTDPWSPPVIEETDDGVEISVTLKQAGGYDAAWTVLRAPNAAKAKEVLASAEFKEVLELSYFGAEYYHSLGGNTAAGSAAGSQPRQSPPQGATTAPAGAPAAPGPDWVYKTGIAKSGRNAGKQWHAWMPPQHLKDSESPMWFDL